MYFSEHSVCTFKKFFFLHKLFRLDNEMIMKNVLFYSQSAEFVFMCYDFDIAVNICTIRDIRCTISDHFSCVANGN